MKKTFIFLIIFFVYQKTWGSGNDSNHSGDKATAATAAPAATTAAAASAPSTEPPDFSYGMHLLDPGRLSCKNVAGEETISGQSLQLPSCPDGKFCIVEASCSTSPSAPTANIRAVCPICTSNGKIDTTICSKNMTPSAIIHCAENPGITLIDGNNES